MSVSLLRWVLCPPILGADSDGVMKCGPMPRIIDLAFERLVRSISDFAEALGVTYGGAANNIGELIALGVAEEVIRS